MATLGLRTKFRDKELIWGEEKPKWMLYKRQVANALLIIINSFLFDLPEISPAFIQGGIRAFKEQNQSIFKTLAYSITNLMDHDIVALYTPSC
jgi:hypothetical protein